MIAFALLLQATFVIAGFNTIVIPVLSFALITTSVLIYEGVIANEPVAVLLSISAVFVIFFPIVWWVLSKMTTKSEEPEFGKIEFPLVENLTEDSDYKHEYSGVFWQVKSLTPLIKKGTTVKVVRLESSLLWVEPK